MSSRARSGDHLDELAPPHQQLTQLLCLGIWQGPRGWFDGLRKVRDDASVKAVGFRQDAHAWQGPDVAGVDHDYGEGGGRQGGHEGPL